MRDMPFPLLTPPPPRSRPSLHVTLPTDDDTDDAVLRRRWCRCCCPPADDVTDAVSLLRQLIPTMLSSCWCWRCAPPPPADDATDGVFLLRQKTLTYLSRSCCHLRYCPPAEDATDAAVLLRQVILMMVVCVAAFTLAWLPFHVFELTTQHYPAVLNWPHVRQLYWVVHAVAMSHCCMNPVIYFTMNDKFRERLRQALGRRRGRSGRSPSGRDHSRMTLECQQMNRVNGTSARSSYLNSVKCDTSAV